jgi:undecaprenyl-diphosphatase
MYFQTPAWDLWLFKQANMAWRHPALDWLMPVISGDALWVVLLCVFLIYSLYKKDRKQVLLILALGAAIGLSDMSANIFKDAVGRVRPLNQIAETWLHEDGKWQQRPADFKRQKQDGTSYPSSHAANAAAAICLVFIFIPGTRNWIWIIPLVIGYSRLYLGKHFPTDVLAGWVFGLGPGFVCAWIYYSINSRLPEWKAKTE